MEFKEYNCTDKNGKSNCVIRSICKFYSLSYEAVEEALNKIAKETNKNFNDIEVFETYMKQLYIYPIDYSKDIKIKDLTLDDGKYAVLCYDKKDYYHMVYIEDGILYDKDDKSLELYTINVYKLNKLELYKSWFDNNTFFNNNSFVVDNVNFLWDTINYIGLEYSKRVNPSIEALTSNTKEENVELAQRYFDNHNIDMNINKLISDGILILADEQKEKNEYTGSDIDGNSYFDEDKNQVIAKIKLKNRTYDSLIIVHELTHNRNQPHGIRNLTSDLLTESISYINELIACDELLDDKDKEKYFKGYENFMYQLAYNLYYIYKIILTYKHQNDITEEAYNKEFSDNNYMEVITNFDRYVNTKQSIFKNSYYVLSIPLTIYMFNEYKKDNNFFKKIEELNNSINTKSFNDCLNIIGINNLDDLLNKFKSKNEEFMNYVDEIYNKNRAR